MPGPPGAPCGPAVVKFVSGPGAGAAWAAEPPPNSTAAATAEPPTKPVAAPRNDRAEILIASSFRDLVRDLMPTNKTLARNSPANNIRALKNVCELSNNAVGFIRYDCIQWIS